MRFEKVIGIDAGGSKTRIVIASIEQLEAGNFDDITRLTSGAANFRLHGESGVRRLIGELRNHIPADDLYRTFVLGAFAGAGDPEIRISVARPFEEGGFPSGNVVVTSDVGLILMAMGGTGIALIAGTGSICGGTRTARPEQYGEIEIRAGGYGDRIPSESGGYRLGIGAIDAALRIADGRVEITSLLYRAVLEHFDLNDVREVLSILYPPGADDRTAVTGVVAGLAERVLHAAHEGDRIARRLVDETVEELANLVRTVLERIGSGDTRIGLHGGLFADRHGEDLLIAPLRKRLEEMGHQPVFVPFGLKREDPDPLLDALRAAIPP